ncbi:MAG: FtsW/RodA/SpoVE family cell cycle protein [Anaerolineae bacterium]|nr:FtsW/RodA/SpoVE family cell cycle protein [Anaerolineae bacterium]
MTGARIWRHFDYVLLLVAVLLTVFGVVMVHSATKGSLDENVLGLWRRQAIVGAAGVGLVFLLAAFPRDYQWFGDFWWLAFLVAVVLLVLLFPFGGSDIADVKTWFDLGVFTVQPSYLAMILLAISIGAMLSRRRRRRRGAATPLFGAPKTQLMEEPVERPGLVNYLVSAGMMLVMVALIFLQPDMATAAVLISMWLAMVFESDMPVRYMFLTIILGLAGLYPVWKLTEVLEFGYMRDRVLGFFNPEPSYQVGQALIAIGSGGFLGKGLGQGTQSQLRYLPARHTDFIFAVTAEELGFAGIMLLFVLYAVLFLRLLRVIMIASDTYGRLLATGVLAMILFQFVVNIGMNLGVLPVAGLPLPFISYGATALLTTLVGIGIAENVVMRHRRFEF